MSKQKKLPLYVKILIALFSGLILVFFTSQLGWNHYVVDWIYPFGLIFINLLKLIAVPLVLFSIINGISSLHDATKIGKLAYKTLAYYLITTITAISIGLLLVNSFKPGEKITPQTRLENRFEYELWVKNTPGIQLIDGVSFLEKPELKEKLNTYLEKKGGKHDIVSLESLKVEKLQKTAEGKDRHGPLTFLIDMFPSNIFASLSNIKHMLQVIVFAVIFGFALLYLPQQHQDTINKFNNAFYNAFIKMMDMIMKPIPYFVFALFAGSIAKEVGSDPDKLNSILENQLFYGLIVLGGLLAVAFIFYPIVLSALTKISPIKFIRAISEAQSVAFSTSSSAATLPVTMECVEHNLKVPKHISGFVLPIGSTVNMDGTSLYQAVAIVFLAQYHMIDLTFIQQLVIVGTATIASIGSAAIPSAGLVMMLLIIQTLGLNPAWIAIIIPIDRLLDMCRTVVNVTGDATVATIIANNEKKTNSSGDK